MFLSLFRIIANFVFLFFIDCLGNIDLIIIIAVVLFVLIQIFTLLLEAFFQRWSLTLNIAISLTRFALVQLLFLHGSELICVSFFLIIFIVSSDLSFLKTP